MIDKEGNLSFVKSTNTGLNMYSFTTYEGCKIEVCRAICTCSFQKAHYGGSLTKKQLDELKDHLDNNPTHKVGVTLTFVAKEKKIVSSM